MHRQLSFPLHQCHSLIAGHATRILVRRNHGDKPALTDEGWLITADDGHPRFAVNDTIAISAPKIGHVATLRLTRIIDAPVELARLGNANAAHYGYEDVSDLWQDWAFRYDKPTFLYWKNCKRFIQAADRSRVFRELLTLRPPAAWWGWTLHVMLQSVATNAQGVAS